MKKLIAGLSFLLFVTIVFAYTIMYGLPQVRSTEPVRESPEETLAYNTTAALTPTSYPQAETDTCDNLQVLVDKQHALPPHYEPVDLVSLAETGIPAGSASVRGRMVMIEQLQQLFMKAQQAGIELVVVSGYRSYQAQSDLYTSYASQYGDEEANRFSARPGHSQHQLGTALDFSNSEVGYSLVEAFANTVAGQWLQTNAPAYGFYLSYPKGLEYLTGYQYEPWHFRYLGIKNVQQLQQSGLPMQIYLEQTGILPVC